MSASTAGRVLLALLACWVVLGFASPPSQAQDGVPLVVAGRLLTSHPHDVYNGDRADLYDLNPNFRRLTCEVVVDPVRCEKFGVAFISSPASLPLVWLISRPPADLAVRLIGLAAGLVAAATMAVIWHRLAGRSPMAPWLLVVTALILTPLVLFPVQLGQTSPLMALSAALGMGTLGGRWGRRWASAALVAVSAFKALPVVLIGLLALGRRWRAAIGCISALAALTAIAVAMGGTHLVGDFLRSTRAVSAQTPQNPYNAGIEAVLYRAPGLNLTTAQAAAGANVVRLVALPVLLAFGRRLRGDGRWAFAWAAIVVITPLSWWHYALASLAALAVAISVTPRSADRLRLLPIAAVASLPMTLASFDSGAMVIPKFAWALAMLVAVGWVANEGSSDRSTASAPQVEVAK